MDRNDMSLDEFGPGTLVCITGAAGSVGSKLVVELASKGVPVRAVVRKREQLERSPCAGVAVADVVEADFTKPESLQGILDGCSVVYHTAATVPGGQHTAAMVKVGSGTDLADYYATTVLGTQALLTEAMRAGIRRFVHVSSVAVYGYPRARDVGEDFPWQPADDPYAWSKQLSELAVRVASKANKEMEVAIARPGDIIGPDQRSWITDFARQVKQGLLQPPIRSGMMNPVYIDDVISALLLLGQHPAAAGEAFNIVSDTHVPISAHIRALAKIVKRRVVPVPPFAMRLAANLIEYQARLRGVEPLAQAKAVEYLFHDITFSNAKAKHLLGWYPAVGWREGMRRSAAWLRAGTATALGNSPLPTVSGVGKTPGN